MPPASTPTPVMRYERISHWEDIPQTAEIRVSTAARRRFLQAGLRTLAWVSLTAIVLGGLGASLHYLVLDGGGAPAAASEPIRELRLTTNGVLTEEWLRETLSLRPGSRMLEVDILALKRRVEACGQVRGAVVSRAFPSTLVVRVEERAPLLRLRAVDPASGARDLLVDAEGVVYSGINYNPDLLSSLPHLAGVRLRRQGSGYAPISGVGRVATLLALARDQAPLLAATWRSVSLAEEPRVIVSSEEVRQAVLDPNDLPRQLARLDYILDFARQRGAGPMERVDLTTGSQVAVQGGLAAAAPADASPASPAAAYGAASPPSGIHRFLSRN